VTAPYCLGSGRFRVPGARQLGLIVLCGLRDTAGNAFFVLAAQTGRLDTAAVLTTLYPASTVLLAAAVLRERLNARQWLGRGRRWARC
jgi:uncharacterized membrane protein